MMRKVPPLHHGLRVSHAELEQQQDSFEIEMAVRMPQEIAAEGSFRASAAVGDGAAVV